MASVNTVIIVGNLGKDPEVRYTANGAAICSVTVATSRQWKDKASGERQEETEWHRITFFDRLAAIAGEYLKKRRPVYVEGRLKDTQIHGRGWRGEARHRHRRHRAAIAGKPRQRWRGLSRTHPPRACAGTPIGTARKRQASRQNPRSGLPG